ncbi:MAG: C40 family peptidase [Thermoleophilia bacterium]
MRRLTPTLLALLVAAAPAAAQTSSEPPPAQLTPAPGTPGYVPPVTTTPVVTAPKPATPRRGAASTPVTPPAGNGNTPNGGNTTPVAPQDRPFTWALAARRRMVTDGVWPSGDTALSSDSTRRQLARGLAAILRTRGNAAAGANAASLPPDVPAGDPDAAAIAVVAASGLMGPRTTAFHPDATVTARQADAAVVRALGLTDELRGLAGLHTADGTRFRLPAGFAAAVLVREMGLRHNYPADVEAVERSDAQPMHAADLMALVNGARTMDAGRLSALAAYRDIQLPDMGDAQRSAVQAALWQVGHPYVWGGDWPTTASPWGGQAAGGFDCSGLVWWAFKGAPRSQSLNLGGDLRGRTADDMAWEAPGRRVPLAQLAAGDLVFFGAAGPATKRGGISHAAISLGGGWIVQSSGSRAGVSVTWLAGYWTAGQAWGRRPVAMGAPPVPVNNTPVTTTPVTTAPAVAPR